MTYRYIHGELALREVTASDEDAYQVALWRNSELAQHNFIQHDVTTPDTHRQFVRSRKPHDLVWFVDQLQRDHVCNAWGEHPGFWVPIGMVSLTVDIQSRSAEAGRLFVAPTARGPWIGKRVINLASHFAFEVLGLRFTWCDIVPTNKPVIWLHRKLGWEQVTCESLGLPWTLRRQDMVYFRLTKEAWRARQAREEAPVSDGNDTAVPT